MVARHRDDEGRDAEPDAELVEEGVDELELRRRPSVGEVAREENEVRRAAPAIRCSMNFTIHV